MIVKEHLLFPTTIMTFDLSDDIGDLEDITKDYQGTPHMLVENNGSSNYGVSDAGGAASWLIQSGNSQLRRTLQKCVNLYTEKLSLNSLTIVNSWMNHMGKGGNVKQHRHEGSVVSGAFYPKLDEGSVGLTFHSPIKPYRMNDLFVDVNDLNSYEYVCEAKEKHLVLFPSWLEHSTTTNKTDDRFVISFNTQYAFNF